MDELKYVLKCFLFSGLLLMFSQVETDGVTYESKIEVFLTQSEAAQFMQEAAAGGVKAIEKALVTTKAFVSDKMNGTSNTSKTK